jgi:HSP20 family protein
MANENQPRDMQSRQQSAERSQSGSSQQGTGGQHGTSYGQGSQGQGQYGQAGGRYGGSQGAGQGTSGRPATGVSTWQGGRQGGAMQNRTSSSLSPYYGGGYGSGPFSIMRRISDEMDRLFENFGMGRGLFPSASSQGSAANWDAGDYNQGMPSMWSPHVEVRERNGKLVIDADLPGMKRDDINVRVEDDEVIIQGERHQETSGTQSGYYRSERSYGSFYRTIPLPEGTNADTANATFRDGVLEIEFDMPRQQQRGRTLQIREGQSGGQSGTSSGATYGSGTTGSMEGATSGQHLQSGTSGGTGSQQHSAGGAAGTQQSQSGTGGSAGGGVQQASGSGTTYSGSGNPSVGAAGMGASQTGSSSDKSSKS